MTVTRTFAPAEGRAEREPGSHHLGPLHPQAEGCLWFPNSPGDLGVKACLQGERPCLAVAPGLGIRRGIHGSEPQPHTANTISISRNKVSFYQQRHFQKNIFH